ncbi:phage tail tube protein [Paenarthrobacter sp. A20]|uniref:phage tail tube protein n=1 Tax=Paenarthrobacter sp. A20 TaxID=2817891 RepID=UPI0020A201FD|nr:IPT/TIG domain-containing protein [Paenarthrobacter sp. A20]MCP1414407.1 hypothetical protein [Paenarthrobacter sp. A20]
MSASLARRFKLDVSGDGTNWLPFKGMTDFAPTENPTTQSTADYDSDGFDSFEKTLTGWQLVAKANRKVNAGVFDPGQELVRARQFKFGDEARIWVRWYDRNGAPEARSGRALVEWNQSKTGVADIEEVTATFKGDGALEDIDNPHEDADTPVIASATPSGAAAGTTVTIQGANFTGTVPTTGVKFGATNASNWQVISDSLISAVVPAGSAGAANIVVTNAEGASTAFPYTRGA